MIVDADDRAGISLLGHFDACVVGSGPAGITLARKLAAGGMSVGLFEAGGLDYSEQSQEFYRGKVVDHSYYDLDATRLRYFGGTSNHWAGWTRELDAIDFSEWPITKGELDKYAGAADEILDLDPSKGPPADFLGWERSN